MMLVKDLMAQSEKTIKENDGDYIDKETGLLMCGKCNTPKQCIIEIEGTTYKPHCLCKCGKERRDRAEEEERQREFERRVRKYREMGFSETQMQKWTFENDDLGNKKLTDIAKRYVDNFDKFYKEGKGLLLWGGVGTGKTYMACMIANALIDKGHPVLVTNFTRILNILQNNPKKQEYLDSLNQFKLLVIDDLGVERNTEYAKEQVFSIIDSRYRAELPMIVTTNLSIQDLVTETNIAYKRVYDRIIERCYPIEVSGESRRIKKLLNTSDDMKSILGI